MLPDSLPSPAEPETLAFLHPLHSTMPLHRLVSRTRKPRIPFLDMLGPEFGNTTRAVMRFLLLCIFLLSLPAVGTAQGAQQLFLEGEAAFGQGNYEGSIKLWKAAYAKDARPLILFNIAQAHERLGDLEAALQALDKYLQTARPGELYEAEARAKRANIQARLERTGIVVAGAPDGASVVIDGKKWGVTPRPDPIKVKPGSHEVVLSKEGYDAFRAAVVVPAGDSVTVRVTMVPRAAPIVTARDADLGAETSLGAERPLAESQPRPFPVLPVALLAGGGAMLIGGAALGFMAVSEAGDTRDGSGDASSLKTQALVADVLGGAGLVAAGVGAVLLVTSSRRSERMAARSRRMNVQPVISARAVGARARVTF